MKSAATRWTVGLLVGALCACTEKPLGTPGTNPGNNNTGDELCKEPDDAAGAPLLGGAVCDPMVSTACGYPFPSNVYTQNDSGSPTGLRVRFPRRLLPKVFRCKRMDASAYDDSDGFSPGQAPMTHLPGATVAGCATVDDPGKSLEAGSPTVLIEAETGARVPHWAELDLSTSDDADRAFMLRPVVRLKDATRYIVAIRRIRDLDDKLLEPSPVFKALRDGTESGDPSVAARKTLYADIFAKLAGAGIQKDDLQVAWDYTTASRANNTAALLKMRDEALALVGAQGPEYTITKVTENPNQYIRRRIEGTLRAPLYLTEASPTGVLNRGADGLPVQNGWADYPFLVQIPNSVADDAAPAAILQQGHGLLGRKSEGQNGYFARLAQEKKFVTIAMDMTGMSAEDEETVKELVKSDMARFKGVADRQHQGVLNSLLAMRMMMGRFVNEAQVQFNGHSAIDPARRFYRGDSQGGIMGATYMALTTDVVRGYLGEPGMPYNLLLYRSVDFDEFFVALQATYSSALDLQIVMGLVQMHWDRAEPNGWAPYIAGNLLPGTPGHQVLINAAIGDYQVTPLGAQIMARAVGAKNLRPLARPVWGVEEADEVRDGSAYTEFDYKIEVPKTNTPPRGAQFPHEDDPHDKVRELKAVFDQTDLFLREGVARNFCDGPCDPD